MSQKHVHFQPSKVRRWSLPSYTGQRWKPIAVKGGRRRKKHDIKACVKFSSRTIVCLPSQFAQHVNDETVGNFEVAIPRGKKRQQMAALGLVAKMSLGPTWNGREVRDEISSCLKIALYYQISLIP